MCLDIKRGVKPKKAKKDITCYKVVYEKCGSYFTIYQNFFVEIGKKYLIPGDIASVVKPFYTHNTHKDFDVIREGAFHSFSNKAHAVYEAKYSQFHKSYVIKCIIPKGTEYIKGVYTQWDNKTYHDVPSYASKSLKCVEVL